MVCGTTIREIGESIGRPVGLEGGTECDTSKLDGTPQRLLDVSLLAAAGWRSTIDLDEGIQRTLAWYRENADRLRG